jgi:dihydrofolate synthase / folylpolyglutamate synthase
MKFADFSAVETYLNSLINYEKVLPLGGRDFPKLDPTLAAIRRLDLPLRLPSCIHIAGTKGKGSAVSFLESLLAPEKPTLAFTSPHLLSIKERVRFNGQVLDDSLWQEGFADIASVLALEPTITLTYFESSFIFFLWAARKLGTQVHIVECGLGGRWDATNVLENATAVLTLVDYDHTHVLGSTLFEIARDKSGIIKRSSNVIVGRQPMEALTEIKAAAENAQAHAYCMNEDFRWLPERESGFRYEEGTFAISGLSLSLLGTHQRDNAAIALCAARRLAIPIADQAVRKRLFETHIPGRQQLLPGTPPVLLDVAHNAASFRTLADTLREHFATRHTLAVVGMMKDKNARACLESLRGLVQAICIVEMPNPRAMKQAELLAAARELGVNAIEMPTLESAFERLHQPTDHDFGVVAGSFYLAGDYLLWRQRAGIA